MKLRHALAALAALLLVGAADARVQALTAEEIEDIHLNSHHHSYPQQPLDDWEADLRRNLGELNPERVADALARRYGLSSAQMRPLVRLWMTVRAREFEADLDPATKTELRRQLLALATSAHRPPLVLQAVAESLNALNECSAEDFAALVAGSGNPAADAWMIANVAPCSDNFLRAAAIAPGREMPALIRLADWGSLEAGAELPLDAWLTSPSALGRIATGDRPALAGRLYRRYLRLLFETGFTDQAVALFDALPPDLRSRIATSGEAAFVATVDGLPVAMEQESPDGLIGLELAAAYALRGRTAEAEALLRAAVNLAVARRAFACVWEAARSDDPPTNCGREPVHERIDYQADALLLDHFLNHPLDDPYPFAEAAFARNHTLARGAPVAELRCRVFAEPQYAPICDAARATVRHRSEAGAWGADSAESARAIAALEAMPLPGFAEARRAFAAELARVRSAAAAAASTGQPARRETVIPAPVPFAELPLPGAFQVRRRRPAQRPPAVASLPEGFIPVRFERSGERAVAISLSQTFDPTGEVSQGGYWVHLSQDGGRSWDRPLYTGLADRFPYVVPPDSAMPMLNRGRLDLEVEVAELDTASISYPPVSLRSRRQASGLYLQIPLTDLARDSDGDGLTDIAERTLLLDRARTDGGTPFIIGSDPAQSCGEPSRGSLALAALLAQLFSREAEAIVEPMHRSGNELALGEGWRGAAAPFDRPLFIRGNPRDYFCLRTRRLMVVYGEQDIAELERFRPDFHAVEVPQVVYNRSRDRGYAQWSAGWTGGTFRLRLVAGRWVVDTISSWIT